MPALERLHLLERPEDAEEEGGSDEKAADNPAVPGSVDSSGDGDSANQEADQTAV